MYYHFFSLLLFQVATLKDQLAVEIRKRQQYITHSVRTNEEIHDIRHQTLDDFPKKAIHNPKLESLLVEHESKKLEEMLDRCSPALLQHRGRSTTRAFSPSRMGRISTMARSGSLHHTPVPLRSSVGK